VIFDFTIRAVSIKGVVLSLNYVSFKYAFEKYHDHKDEISRP